jgi:hypothetical protein
MKKSSYYSMIEELCGSYNSGDKGHVNGLGESEKTDRTVAKRKKIIKISSSPEIEKKGRGRPRKVV